MRLQYFLFVFLIIISCKKVSEKEDSVNPLPPKMEKIKIEWLTDKTVRIKIDPDLSYHKGFDCDSVIGIDYIGFESEHFYYPINEKGQFINTINKKRRLSSDQISKLNSIIGNKKTYENPNITGCYEPRLGFIYFKNNSVICQTQICLECLQLQSSAETVKGTDGNFNYTAAKDLTKLKIDLGFN